MPSNSFRPPAYRHYKPKDLAVVRLNGKDIYLGKFDSPESWRRYYRELAAYLGSSDSETQPPRAMVSAANETYTIKKLAIAYVEFAETDYLRDGRLSAEVDRIRYALRRLIKLYGDFDANEFGPKALNEVREEFVRCGQRRSTVNANISRLKRMFRWAAENELIPVTTYQAVATVVGLKKGRGTAKESKIVRPAEVAAIDAAIPYMPKPVADMVQLQRLTGCRPGELCGLRPCDVNRESQVWCFRPASHKTEHHGIERRIYLGPKAQAILSPWLDRDPLRFCFSPAEEVKRQLAAKHARRKTPLTYGNRPGSNRKLNPNRTPKDHYTTASYRRAVERACVRAKIPVWTPNQLRHARATELRRLHGLDAAQVVLGHSDAFVTQIYAERDFSRAQEIMRELG
jgi:integrase